jgi:hypothetical protein
MKLGATYGAESSYELWFEHDMFSVDVNQIFLSGILYRKQNK